MYVGIMITIMQSCKKFDILFQTKWHHSSKPAPLVVMATHHHIKSIARFWMASFTTARYVAELIPLSQLVKLDISLKIRDQVLVFPFKA